MTVVHINKARLVLFLIFTFFVFSLQCLLLVMNGVSSFLCISGVLYFSIGVSSLGEKVVSDILLRAVHNRYASSIHLYMTQKALYSMGIILVILLVTGVMIGIENFIKANNMQSAFGLFGYSSVLLSLCFLVDTGRLVFINNEYIIYHQGLYKKVIAYQHADASVICIVEDGKKRQKTAAIKFKNLETRSKVIEDFVKNGLKEECE